MKNDTTDECWKILLAIEKHEINEHQKKNLENIIKKKKFRNLTIHLFTRKLYGMNMELILFPLFHTCTAGTFVSVSHTFFLSFPRFHIELFVLNVNMV